MLIDRRKVNAGCGPCGGDYFESPKGKPLSLTLSYFNSLSSPPLMLSPNLSQWVPYFRSAYPASPADTPGSLGEAVFPEPFVNAAMRSTSTTRYVCWSTRWGSILILR